MLVLHKLTPTATVALGYIPRLILGAWVWYAGPHLLMAAPAEDDSVFLDPPSIRSPLCPMAVQWARRAG